MPSIAASAAGSLLSRPMRTRLSSCGCVIFASDEDDMLTGEHVRHKMVPGGSAFMEFPGRKASG